MGTYSWTCAKTNLPILGAESWGTSGSNGHDLSEFTKAVLLFPDKGIVAHGTYCGYGRFEMDEGTSNRGPRSINGPMEFSEDGTVEALGSGRAKLVLSSYYDPRTDGFETLGKSRMEPGQGHFHAEEFILRCREAGRFASYEGYQLAYFRFLDFDAATRITMEQARAVVAARRSLSIALLRARESSVSSYVDVFSEAPDHCRPAGFTLVSVDGSLDIMSVTAMAEPDKELARFDLTAAARGEDTFALAARTIVEAMVPRTAAKVSFEREGLLVCDVEVIDSPMGEAWYEVMADGVSQVFWDGDAVLDGFGIERERKCIEALYPLEPIPEPVTIQVLRREESLKPA